MNACTNCGSLSRWPGLCCACYERGVLTHAPRFENGTGKVLEPGSATPSGMRAVGLALVLFAILGAAGLLRFGRGEEARSFAPLRAQPYVAEEPAQVIKTPPKAKPPRKARHLRH